ncbi:MAG: phage/plasmid primase, P4 family, partial [Candidatus Poribacteria bacterium]|nr:phage/plasmid primase, P4 family [Candidatus Poribacteria bacterium]
DGMGRNAAGFLLAVQLRDDGLDFNAALDVMREYVTQVNRFTPKDHPYQLTEAVASLRQAMNRAARQPAERIDAAPTSRLPEDSRAERIAEPPIEYDAAPDSTPTLDRHIFAFPQTDAGNAELIAALYRNMLRYDHRLDRWLLWDAHRWGPDHTDSILQLAKRAARERRRLARYEKTVSKEDHEIQEAAMKWGRASESNSKIVAALNLAKSETPIAQPGNVFDADRWLIGLRNGVIDLTSGKFREGRQSDHITMSAGAAYDPHADCPRWRRFLSEVFPQNPNDPPDQRKPNQELIDYVQRIVGYTLSGSTELHQMWVLYGEKGRNGKGVFLNTLAALFGGYALTTPFSTFEPDYRKNAGSATPELAEMLGKRFVSSRESDQYTKLDPPKIKAMTGGDPIKARPLYANPFEFYPNFKLFLATNYRPIISDTSEAMWDRVKLIPFEVYFSEDERDTRLEIELQTELPGILNWAVEGFRLWQEKGLGKPEIVAQHTQQYRLESDPVQQFLDSCTIKSLGAEVRAKYLFNLYVEWCTENGIAPPKTATPFGRAMTSKAYQRVRNAAGQFVYVGIEISDNAIAYGEPNDEARF